MPPDELIEQLSNLPDPAARRQLLEDQAELLDSVFIEALKEKVFQLQRADVRRAYAILRDQIHRDHHGIKEEFTMIRPRTAYN